VTRAATAVVVLGALLAIVGAASSAERIERFISDVDVRRNGDLQVVETIDVRAEGREIRRGILRDFPTTYRRADGSRVQVGFEVERVTRDGVTEAFATEKMANGVRVRIGRGDHTISPGLHRYVIRYRTTRQIGFFADYDELYWNATGTGWTFPIDVAETRINLPEPVPFRQAALYTGPQGARDKNAEIVEQRPGRIIFRTTRPLPVANGLTVAAAWQKGVVTPPTQRQQFEAMLRDDPALLTAAVGGGGVIVFYLLAWLLVGGDPRRGTIIPLFAPPRGMSAAAVRYVWEMRFDDRVFAAAVVGLGVNGHLRLIDRGADKELRHVKSDRPLDRAERALQSALFATKSTVSLDTSEHKLIADARHKLHQALQQDYKSHLFTNNFWWSGLGLAGAVLVTSWLALDYSASYGSSTPGILAGMFIPLIPIMIAAAMVRSGLRQGGSSGRSQIRIGLSVAAIAVAIGLAFLSYNVGFGPAILPAMVPYVLAAIAALGFSWLQAPTRAGRKVMDQIEGFRQYLGVAEEDRLEFLNPPEKTPELFERFLPYAIALDVQNTWAQRFAGVLATAAVGAAAASTWYSGNSGRSGDVVSFADRLGDNLSRTIASASTSPGSTSSGSSGGSSGGGSSGGGGGGGGGSGW
jgi:hypothetical protein